MRPLIARSPNAGRSRSITAEAIRTIPFARPWITDDERQAVDEVLRGPILTHGPQGVAFESEFGEFLGADAHCVTVSSCMAALHLACVHFGLGPGDEAIVPAQTHVATAHAVEWTGARPVFVDCEPETGNVTAELIEAAITPRTKAILLVHYLGIPCEMPAIVALAERHGLSLIEDAALAVGTSFDGVAAGLSGDAGCFSFYPVKHITTAEGGMFVSRHAEVAETVARLRAFWVDRRHDERTIPGMYDVTGVGLNYRMSEIQAAIGRVQLGRIDENLARRDRNFGVLRSALSDLDGVRILDAKDQRAVNSHYCLGLVLDEELAAKRVEIIQQLTARGVGTSVYYPQPVPRMTYYREKYGYDEAQVATAAAISDRSIALPVGPHIDGDDASYVAESVVAVLSQALA